MSFLKRKRKKNAPGPDQAVSPHEASLLHAEARLDELKRRVKDLESVKTVVTVRSRQSK